MVSCEGQVKVRVVIVRDLRGGGEPGERRGHGASHSKSQPKRNHQEPEPPTAQLSCHPCPAWALCGSLAGAVAPSRLVLTVRALPCVKKTGSRKSGNCRHGQLWIVMEAIALAESNSRACQLLGIRDTLTLSSSTNLNACPGSPNQR